MTKDEDKIFNCVAINTLIIALFKYWFGFIGYFWGFFIAGYWTDVTTPLLAPTKLSARVNIPWIISAVAGLSIVVFVLLPTLYF